MGRKVRVLRVLTIRHSRFWLAAAALLLVVAAGVSAPRRAQASGLGSMCGNPSPPSGSQVRHLIVLFMENESKDSIIGSYKAPYQSQFASQCGQAGSMFSVTHPSAPNYIGAASATQPLNPARDCVPNYKTGNCVVTDDNVFHQLTVSGQSWRGYAEDMTTNCQLSNSGNYAGRHNSPIFFANLQATNGGTTDCAANDVIMGNVDTQVGQFYTDVRGGNLPALSFIAPNIINDAHSSSIQTGDAYLAKLIPLITAAPNYQAGDTAIVLT
jgi:phosphatidylinositol-3-phosphatase